MKITNYSYYDNYTVMSDTENISDVVDKLIRLTAKITGRYAGDIYYEIKLLYRCLEEHESYDRVLFFRENGVGAVRVEYLTTPVEFITPVEYIQAWRLTHDPETMTTTLTRVTIREENR